MKIYSLEIEIASKQPQSLTIWQSWPLSQSLSIQVNLSRGDDWFVERRNFADFVNYERSSGHNDSILQLRATRLAICFGFEIRMGFNYRGMFWLR